MKSARVISLASYRPATKETTMSSRTRRLLKAFEEDFRTPGDDVGEVDADAVDAAFSKKMGSGELTQERLDAAFARQFPERSSTPNKPLPLAALQLGEVLGKWLLSQERTPQSVATEFSVPMAVLQGLLSSTGSFDSTPPADLSAELRPRVRRLLSAVASQLSLKDEEGPRLMAARDTPKPSKK